MRLFAICFFASMLLGCATNRTITIETMPKGALISVGPRDVGPSPVVHPFTWENDTDQQTVRAVKMGYQEKDVMLYRDHAVNGKLNNDHLLITLDPDTRTLTITCDPPARFSIDDKPQNTEYMSAIQVPNLTYSVDEKGHWTKHHIHAERDGYAPLDKDAEYYDASSTYDLVLPPLKKALNITTTPPDAQVFFDSETTPLKPKEERAFPYDLVHEQLPTHTLTARRPGYPDKALTIGWDDARTDYSINMLAYTKSIRIKTNPPGAIVKLDGTEMTRDPQTGDSIVNDLPFPAIDDKGTLKTYTAAVSKPKADNVEWYPTTFTIGWDKQQSFYEKTLQQIRTVPLPLLAFQMNKKDGGWDYSAKTIDTVSAKDVNEPSGLSVERLTPDVIKGQSIDSIALSPDGKRIVFTILVEKPTLHSLMYSISTSGKEPAQLLDDGKSLDVTPSFSPDGAQILFASDRAGDRLSVWGIGADNAHVANVYTSGLANYLWPTMDSDPKPNIFCESFTDKQDQPRIYKAQFGTVMQTDLGITGAHQPRINPTNDAVLFSAYNEKTNKRDIFRISTAGDVRQNLTNTPDIDEYDAVWDRAGARIAYVSDGGVDQERRHNADIWALDLTASNAVAKQITFNASQDDCPVWDPTGRAIYFRSNRGGEWGIWKINLK